MTLKHRLLILSCSQRKRPTSGLLPAIERYNGPLFQVLHRFLREHPNARESLNVYILSGAYGLIPSDCPIEAYDWKMTSCRAAELRPEILETFAQIIQNGSYAHLCLAMGETYLTALAGWQDLVPENMKLTVAGGPMGVKQNQLKSWLWEVLPNNGERQ